MFDIKNYLFLQFFSFLLCSLMSPSKQCALSSTILLSSVSLYFNAIMRQSILCYQWALVFNLLLSSTRQTEHIIRQQLIFFDTTYRAYYLCSTNTKVRTYCSSTQRTEHIDEFVVTIDLFLIQVVQLSVLTQQTESIASQHNGQSLPLSICTGPIICNQHRRQILNVRHHSNLSNCCPKFLLLQNFNENQFWIITISCPNLNKVTILNSHPNLNRFTVQSVILN